jgi:hypothetical protein
MAEEDGAGWVFGRIVSGGQTGADRGALDFAIERGIGYGGFLPAGRKAEDGRVSGRYRGMTELADAGYHKRTVMNITGSDATLIVNRGHLSGGTKLTADEAGKRGKPFLVVQLDGDADLKAAAARAADWLRSVRPGTLNVAGPRESKRPGIQALTAELLREVDISTLSVKS